MDKQSMHIALGISKMKTNFLHLNPDKTYIAPVPYSAHNNNDFQKNMYMSAIYNGLYLFLLPATNNESHYLLQSKTVCPKNPYI